MKKKCKLENIAKTVKSEKKNNDFCIKMAEVLGVPVLS